MKPAFFPVIMGGRRGSVTQVFSPASLFTSGVQGAWYDPSDYTSLFQDSAGTTAVTAVEQPVGLMLDKSQGATAGAELVPDSSFDTPASWTPETADWVVSGGKATYTKPGAGVQYLQSNDNISIVSGTWYRLTFTISGIASGNAIFGLFNKTASTNYLGGYQTISANGTSSIYFLATSSTTGIRIYGNAGGTATSWSFDSFSIKAIAGNHATQATTASRPVLRARYNLLTYSEQFNNSVWTTSAINATATANQATAPDGTVTADLMQATAAGANSFLYINPSATSGVTYTTSIYVKRVNADWFALSNSAYFAYFNISAGTVGSVGEGSASITDVGSGWWRIVWSGQTNVSNAIRVRAVTANNNPNVSGGEQYYIWGADLRTGSSAGTYQRIAAATDYATAGFLPYLDLITDDSYSTNSIDFTATDKMFVCAGVTKNSDSGTATVLEAGTNAYSSAGFNLFAPRDATAATYGFSLYQTALASYSAATFAAPITSVVSCAYDYAGATIADEIKPRINGVIPSLTIQNAGPAGTGNFGNYSLYIGRRNYASLPLNGRIYSLIVCGKTLSASELASTESFVATKTGVTL